VRKAIIALVVVLALGAVAFQSVRVHSHKTMLAQREAALKDDLFQMRKAIDNFHAEHKRYPSSLDELVPNYLRKIPADPITESLDWNVITEETVAVSSDFTTAEAPKPVVSVLDVKSKAPGVGLDGKPYSEY
jgi:general secretion pathway protein G